MGSGTLLCTMTVLHLKISHAGSHLLKRVGRHMYTSALISKAIFERERIMQGRRKHTQNPYKNKSPETGEPFHFVFTAKGRKAPCPSSKVAKNVNQTHILYLRSCSLCKTNWNWLQSKRWHRSRRPEDSGDTFTLRWELLEVRTARGTQVGDAHLQHSLSAIAALSALAMCSRECPAERAWPCWLSRPAKKNGTILSTMVGAPHPNACGLSLTVNAGNEKKLRSWDHQAAGKGCTSHTWKSFCMTFLGLRLTSMSSKHSYWNLITAKQHQHSFILNIKKLLLSSSKYLEFKDFSYFSWLYLTRLILHWKQE